MGLRARWLALRSRVHRPDSATMRALIAGGLAALAVVLLNHAATVWFIGKPTKLTQEQINAAVEHSLQEVVLPSPAAKAYRALITQRIGLRRYDK